jgi:hypothetical protein
MYPSAMIQEIAYERAAELRRSAGRSRGARAAALASREQDLLARRRLRGSQPDGPIVTARPVRPLAAAPAQQSAPAQQPAPARQPAGVGAATTTATTTEADERVLTACTTC